MPEFASTTARVRQHALSPVASRGHHAAGRQTAQTRALAQLQRAANRNSGARGLATLQRSVKSGVAVQRAEEQSSPNRTGLPDNLKSGIESLSGMSMDHVRVHYNSPKPAQMSALAYAQGSDIHVAPGQERHLAHEAWHVVQQAQGRVKPTMQMRGVGISDDRSLEREADVMGSRAQTQRSAQSSPPQTAPAQLQGTLQRVMTVHYVPLAGAPGGVAAKMANVIDTLTAMGLAVAPPVQLWIAVIQDPNRVGTNPANTQTFGATGIEVDLRSWYIETSTVGEIVGMIGHELGVHDLADKLMTPAETATETANNAVPYGRVIAGRVRPLAPLNGDRRQDDHVNVAKFGTDHTGALVPLPRMDKCIATMLGLGDAIENDPLKGAPLKLREQRDMFQTFLFDLGRIIATDDGAAWAVALGVGNISEVFNWLRDYLIARYAGGHAWLNNVHIADATRTSLLGMLAGKAAKALYAQRGAIGRQALATAGTAVRGTLGAVRATVTAPVRLVRWLFS